MLFMMIAESPLVTEINDYVLVLISGGGYDSYTTVNKETINRYGEPLSE